MKDLIYNFKKWLKQHDFQWKYKLTICLPIFLALVALDWLTKGLAVHFIKYGETIDFIPGFLQLGYILNPGAAGGSGSRDTVIAIATMTVVISTTLFMFLNERKWLFVLTWFIAGGFANLFARAWAPQMADGTYGAVVDFLKWDFNLFFPFTDDYIFNLADIWVNISVALLIVVVIWEMFLFFKGHKQKKVNTNKQATDQQSGNLELLELTSDEKNKPKNIKGELDEI